MLLERLGATWADYKRLLEQGLRVMILDPDTRMADKLSQGLKQLGCHVEQQVTVDGAWNHIQTEYYDLLIADLQALGGSTASFMARCRDAEVDVALVVVSAQPNIESLAEAMDHGAVEYLKKPYSDLPRAAQRVAAAMAQRVQDRLYSRIVRDLSAVVAAGGEDSAVARQVALQLYAFKRALGQRVEVLLIEPVQTVAEVASDALESAGLRVLTCADGARARELLLAPEGPLVAVVSLNVAGSVELIADVHHHDPLLGLLVTCNNIDLSDALRAIDAGAGDVLDRMVEGMEVLRERVARAVRRAIRQRIYLQMVGLLIDQVGSAQHAGLDLLLQMLPEEHHQLLRQRRGAQEVAASPQPVDLAELFDERLERGPGDRVSASLPTFYRELLVAGQDCRGVIRNLSSGGMFIAAEDVLPLGTRLRIDLREGLDPGLQVSTVGEVVRYVKVQPDPGAQTGLGVRVLGPLGPYHRLVTHLLQQQRPSEVAGDLAPAHVERSRLVPQPVLFGAP